MGEARRKKLAAAKGVATQRPRNPDLGQHVLDTYGRVPVAFRLFDGPVTSERDRDGATSVSFHVAIRDADRHRRYCGTLFTHQDAEEVRKIILSTLCSGEELLVIGRPAAEMVTGCGGEHYRPIEGLIQRNAEKPMLIPDVLEDAEDMARAIFCDDEQEIVTGHNPPTDNRVRACAAQILGVRDLDHYEPWHPAKRIMFGTNASSIDVTNQLKELLSIAKSGGFLGDSLSRTRRIGAELHQIGGYQSMKGIHDLMMPILFDSDARHELSSAWNGVGDWIS